MRARIVALSWEGWAVPQSAQRVGCSARTARAWIHRFNAEGMAGLGDRNRPGRPRRLSEGPLYGLGNSSAGGVVRSTAVGASLMPAPAGAIS
jgi:hypothetical protein